ncbi:MAG: RT0821/Lpp0805 family surface protein [Pseudomonadota bacterium]
MENVLNAPREKKRLSRAPKAVVTLLAVAALAGCQSYGGPREGVGALGGAVAGGVLGNQIGEGSGQVVATVAGALVGGLLGAEIGRQLDENARQRYLATQYQALETGVAGAPLSWQAPSGSRGTVVPGQPYQINSQVCRDYNHTVYIEGRPEVLTGTACRQPDGSWRNV